MYGPLGVSSQQYGQYSQFLGEIPEELYALTDPSAEIYQQFRTEQQARLSEQLEKHISGFRAKFIPRTKRSKRNAR